MTTGETCTVVVLKKPGETPNVQEFLSVIPNVALYGRTLPDGRPMDFQTFNKKFQGAKKRLERWKIGDAWLEELTAEELFRVTLSRVHKLRYLNDCRSVWTRPLSAPADLSGVCAPIQRAWQADEVVQAHTCPQAGDRVEFYARHLHAHEMESLIDPDYSLEMTHYRCILDGTELRKTFGVGLAQDWESFFESARDNHVTRVDFDHEGVHGLLIAPVKAFRRFKVKIPDPTKRAFNMRSQAHLIEASDCLEVLDVEEIARPLCSPLIVAPRSVVQLRMKSDSGVVFVRFQTEVFTGVPFWVNEVAMRFHKIGQTFALDTPPPGPLIPDTVAWGFTETPDRQSSWSEIGITGPLEVELQNVVSEDEAHWCLPVVQRLSLAGVALEQGKRLQAAQMTGAAMVVLEFAEEVARFCQSHLLESKTDASDDLTQVRILLARCWAFLGVNQMRWGDWMACREACLETLKSMPASGLALMRLGYANYMLGNPEQAIENYDCAMEHVDAGGDTAQKIKALRSKAVVSIADHKRKETALWGGVYK
ncbi:MAG: uncharacterized protein KVP18_000295 [Porospora cf. gigantea A]|uniref:uncharacterized protein n=1 Tax=Porospora cf. gigantea A TaxID=2853593 RepID=UPI00355A9520|nr:MAG: hypothetical protein KVP18_000295 [Porospora cf. gigantea A]